ncbi:protein fam161a-like [Plakobranchus ocellatus]|uniref:Protein fam161a-like n=1 Tax=Plakobranchus ocellatus TaxID=259542 RepID=A0AAV3YKT1_9GAST|nr:protein fam161a-like [Plakobranchus ocellatus]
MASTSHGLSVFANSCVKNPIQPKTGLNSTLHERSGILIRYDDALKEIQQLDNNAWEENGDIREWVIDHNDESTTAVSEKLKATTAEEFYEKLQQLKEENKRTLEAFERLYQQKLIRKSQSFDFQQDKSGFDSDRKEGIDTSDLEIDTTMKKDMHAGLLFKKPPIGRIHKKSQEDPILSKTLPQRSMHTKIAKELLPESLLTRSRKSRSLDNEEWTKFFSDSMHANEEDNFVIPPNTLSDHEKALMKVDKLWEDFDIAKYSQRRSSASLTQHKSNEERKGGKKSSEWRHRITIPEPFNMSIREALKDSKKTKAQVELEQRRLEKQREEEAECEKKFKARPVPSHVYLPKFEEIMERNESRRQYVKQYCSELLKSQVKPFNFEIREEEKKKQRAQSAPIKRPERPKSGFKAKPAPTHIFKPDVDERLQEEEELRKIRIKMRSKELLREASLPPNMEAREKLKEQERKEKLRKAKQAAKVRQRVKSVYRNAHVVPDYDMLYREFQKELARRKSAREGTVVEPFDLETDKIRTSRDRIQRDIEMDEKRLKENRWPFEGSRETPRSSLRYLGTLSTSLDSIPTHSTRSAELRSTVIKKDKERQLKRQQQKEEEEKRRRVREAKLRRYLSEKTNSDDVPRVRDSIAERLKRKRQEERAAQEAYQQQIEDMKARIDESPLLVEKFMKENAKREAQKKFTKTLRGAGLDEWKIPKGIAASKSVSEDQYESNESGDDEQFTRTAPADTTYVKEDDED